LRRVEIEDLDRADLLAELRKRDEVLEAARVVVRDYLSPMRNSPSVVALRDALADLYLPSHPAPASPPGEDKPEAERELTRDECWEAYLTTSRLARALGDERDTAQAELTRLKADNDQFVGKLSWLDEVVAERRRVEAENARLSGELLNSVKQEQHQEALSWGTRFRDKYHASRREVRRLNAALRVAGLVAREQADRARLSVKAIQEGVELRATIVSLEAELAKLTSCWHCKSSLDTSELPYCESCSEACDKDWCTEDGCVAAFANGLCADNKRRPSQPELASEPRAIVVGSTWRHTWGLPRGALGLRVVTDVNAHGIGHIKLKGLDGTWGDNFRDEFEWVSDPPVSETAEGGAK